MPLSLAERLLRVRLDDLLADRAAQVSVVSAGVRAWAGQPMEASAAAELVRLGGDPTGFISTQLAGSVADDSDLVLTATRALRSRLLEESPHALRRTFTIREFAALVSGGDPAQHPAELVAQAARRRSDGGVDDYDVPDPIGQSAQVHREVADLLDQTCTAIARAVAVSLVEG